MLDFMSDIKQTGSGGDAAAKRWESGTTNQTRGNGRLQILSYLVASESRFESVISRLFLHPLHTAFRSASNASNYSLYMKYW